MGFTKREAVTDLIVLGDDEGQVKKAGGLLAATRQDTMYPSRLNYELVQKNGESKWLAGSASLGRQLGPEDVGRFIKCTFKGWGRSGSGKFKEIEVLVSDDDLPEELLNWPRYDEIQRKKNSLVDEPPLDETQKDTVEFENDDDDSELPF